MRIVLLAALVLFPWIARGQQVAPVINEFHIKAGKPVHGFLAVRNVGAAYAMRLHGDVGQIDVVQANVRNEASVRRALDGAHAAVNLVAIPYEKGRQGFQALHVMGAKTVAEVAREQHRRAHDGVPEMSESESRSSRRPVARRNTSSSDGRATVIAPARIPAPSRRRTISAIEPGPSSTYSARSTRLNESIRPLEMSASFGPGAVAVRSTWW